MRIAVFGDAHIGCTTYTDKRSADFAEKFNQAVAAAVSRRSEAIVLLGDVFDSSAYRRSVDNFALALGEVAPSFVGLSNLKIPLFAIAGNHEYGRGRGGGELKVLSDLGFVHFIEDGFLEYKGLRICGISWRSTPESFREALKALGPPTTNSILLIHQFCEGSHYVPEFLVEVKREDVKGWPIVFAGHQHQHDDLGYAIVPGSLEVQLANEDRDKGFYMYETDTGKREFVKLPESRSVRWAEFDGSGKSAEEFEEELAKWIQKSSSEGALLVAYLDGTLAKGRSVDIGWTHLRTLAYQAKCIKLQFEGGLRDQVRTAPEIKAAMNLNEYLKAKFGSNSKKALKYVESFRSSGDSFGTVILDEILTSVKGSTK